MKRILGVTVAVIATVGAMAQGTVNFANLGAGVNAPVLDTDNLTKLPGGAGWVAQLWAGPTASSLAAIGAPVAFSTSVAGVFLGGAQVIPTVAAGSPAFYQVRVWNTGNGATWGVAYGAAATDPSVKFGFNNANYADPLGAALSISQTPNLTVAPSTPPNLVGLASFHLMQVPEPSVIALGILGAGALLLRRRK